ncbi:MAG: ComEC/Rec2 family competence protein [Pseudomonadota bacterium]
MRAALAEALLAQRGAMIGWVPVCLGVGIGIYFALTVEPDALTLAIVGVMGACGLILSRIAPVPVAPLFLSVSLICAGFGVAKYRAEAHAAPVLTFRYYGPIQGRIVQIDRSASDAERLTLDQVVLSRMSPDWTPARVRVSLHGTGESAPFRPGDTVILTGHLSPPSGPAEPGGFDFQRHAWFLELGAVGYTRSPVLRLTAAHDSSFALRIFAARMALSAAIQAEIDGPPGAFAAAIMTGDRSGMDQDMLEALRASNLAHLLAISGLHMGLLTGFVFALIRFGLAAVPVIALRWPTKKIAAVGGIVVGAGYLALSGGNVATERAFIMVAVMFVAILLNRRALTLRAVAIAAALILVWQPEALIGPGFQMSFAATTALVAVFGALRRFDQSRIPKWSRGALSVVLSSFVAGLATAPIAAAHFNQIAHFGLIANLLSVPLMGVLIMPAALLAMCLAPFGLWGVGLWIVEQGLRWILAVATTVAARPEALSHVIAPQPAVLPLIALGALIVVLVQGRARFAGLAVGIGAMVLWGQSTRPALLIADTGGLIGLQTAEGRALSRPTGNGFLAGVWLENDGNPVSQAEAASRPGVAREGRVSIVTLSSWRITQVSGKTALAEIIGCDGSDILISDQPEIGPRPCLSFDAVDLRGTGALAIDVSPSGDLRITSSRAQAGERLWNAHQEAVRLPAIIARDQGEPSQTHAAAHQ